MKLSKLSFDADSIYAQDETGRIYKQSLLWYPAIKSATDEQRRNFTVGFGQGFFNASEGDQKVNFWPPSVHLPPLLRSRPGGAMPLALRSSGHLRYSTFFESLIAAPMRHLKVPF